MADFRVRDKDGLARTGELFIDDKSVETPALMPVLNPHYGIPDLDGFDIVITNSFIIYGSDDYRDDALSDGLHDVLGFDGVVVTDSGSYQLSVYGDEEVEITNRETVEFQINIGSDVVTPLDIPTPPDASRQRAEEEMETTLNRLRETKELIGDTAVNAPVQGATHMDLRERSAEMNYELGLDIYPIGGVVPLMKDYRFSELVDVVMASHRGLGRDVPIHLFGAGHPMMFGFAAALGCDVFDSAAYALYAAENRYLTENGTLDIDELRVLPCTCDVCIDREPTDLKDHFEHLSAHNLYASRREMRVVRDAINRGNLFELIESRARSHPRLLDGLRQLYRYSDEIESHDPLYKSTPFLMDSLNRPEVARAHQRIDRFNLGDKATITEPSGDGDLYIKPPLPPYPATLEHTYPFNAEVTQKPSHESIKSSIKGLNRLMEINPDTTFTFINPRWSDDLLEIIDERDAVVKNREDSTDTDHQDTEAN